MTNKTKKWIRSGLELLIHGVWAAIVSSMTAWLIDQKDWAWGTANSFKMMFGSFWANGGLRAVQYYMNNPLPPADDSNSITQDGNSIVPQPTISMNPLSKVTTMTTPTDSK